MVSSIAFVLTAITLIVIFITRVRPWFFKKSPISYHSFWRNFFFQATRSKTDSIFSVANSVTSSVLTGFGGLILVIQLTRVSVSNLKKKSQNFVKSVTKSHNGFWAQFCQLQILREINFWHFFNFQNLGYKKALTRCWISFRSEGAT